MKRIPSQRRSWSEAPGAAHRIAENMSGTTSARRLAILVTTAAQP